MNNIYQQGLNLENECFCGFCTFIFLKKRCKTYFRCKWKWWNVIRNWRDEPKSCRFRRAVRQHMSFLDQNADVLRVFLQTFKCMLSLHSIGSASKWQGCRSLPVHRWRKIHFELHCRQSCLPDHECHHSHRSPDGASGTTRTGDVQVCWNHVRLLADCCLCQGCNINMCIWMILKASR